MKTSFEGEKVIGSAAIGDLKKRQGTLIAMAAQSEH